MAENERFVPRRELGRTGFIATALGVGDLADRSVPIETCVATAWRALDAGWQIGRCNLAPQRKRALEEGLCLAESGPFGAGRGGVDRS